MDFLSAAIVIYSLASVALLCFDAFSVRFSVALTFLGIAALGLFLRRSPRTPRPKLHWAFFVVLALAVLLRFHPHPRLILADGADGGVYLKMAEVYKTHGSTFVVDPVRSRIQSPEVLRYYDQENHWDMKGGQPHVYEGTHTPGIYIQDLRKSRYVFQFYPMHPLWMALASALLGPEYRVISLLFLALITLIFFYLIALELSGGSLFSALTAAGFIAVHPVHVYLSKYPLSEVAALAFTSGAVYYLIRYLSLFRSGDLRPRFLVLSAGFWACMVLTRISSFMYIPLVFWGLYLLFLHLSPGRARGHLTVYLASILFLFALSVLYGWHYSYPYFHDVYQACFGPIFGSKWGQTLLGASALLCVASMIAERMSQSDRVRNHMSAFAQRIHRWIPIFITLVIAYGLYQAYVVGFTRKYVGDLWLDQLSGSAWRPWRALPVATLFSVILYLCPLLFGAFVAALWGRFYRASGLEIQFLALFTLVFWGYGVDFRNVTVSFWHARYLLSELLPCTLLWIALYLGWLRAASRRGRKWATALAVIGGVYFLVLSLPQFRGTEGVVFADLDRISQRANKPFDLLFIQKKDFPTYNLLHKSLAYDFHLNTFLISDLARIPAVAAELRKSSDFTRVFLLSTEPPSPDTNRWASIDQIRMVTTQYASLRQLFPNKFGAFTTDLFLYRVL